MQVDYSSKEHLTLTCNSKYEGYEVIEEILIFDSHWEEEFENDEEDELEKWMIFKDSAMKFDFPWVPSLLSNPQIPLSLSKCFALFFQKVVGKDLWEEEKWS